MARHDNQIREQFRGYAVQRSMNRRLERGWFVDCHAHPCARMFRCICSTQTWFRGVAQTLVSSTVARISRRDTCWTQTCFEGLKPSYVSLLLAERPPQERHGLPRIAGVAQAPDRRPLQDRTRRPPSRPDPSRGVLRRASQIPRTFPCLCRPLSFCSFTPFCHSFGPPDGSVHASTFVAQAGWFRSPTELRRRMPPATRVGGFRRRHELSRTRCRRRTLRSAVRGRRAPIILGFWASRQQAGEGHRTPVQVAERTHWCREP